MMLRQLVNTQCAFWNEQNHEKNAHYSIACAERSRYSGSGVFSAEHLKQKLEAEAKANRQRKKSELHRSLTLLSQAHEVIEALGEDLPPLALTALGNMAEQAASTLKLLERDK